MEQLTEDQQYILIILNGMLPNINKESIINFIIKYNIRSCYNVNEPIISSFNKNFFVLDYVEYNYNHKELLVNYQRLKDFNKDDKEFINKHTIEMFFTDYSKQRLQCENFIINSKFDIDFNKPSVIFKKVLCPMQSLLWLFKENN